MAAAVGTGIGSPKVETESVSHLEARPSVGNILRSGAETVIEPPAGYENPVADDDETVRYCGFLRVRK